MIGPDIMNALLGNRQFRELLDRRAEGIDPATNIQRLSAIRVNNQIEIVSERKVGSVRYNLACSFLLQRLNEYLVQFGETEPPYFPQGPKVSSES